MTRAAKEINTKTEIKEGPYAAIEDAEFRCRIKNKAEVFFVGPNRTWTVREESNGFYVVTPLEVK